MKNDLALSTISLIGGAAAGAIAMFLLDPDKGDQRRSQIAFTAGQAVNNTTDSARKLANQWSNKATDYAQNLADQAHGHLSDAHDRLSEAQDHLRGRASSLYTDAKTSATRQIGGRPSHSYSTASGITVGTLGILALGGGLMYFFDPARGRARRDWAKSKLGGLSEQASKSAGQYRQKVGDKIHGVAESAKEAVPGEWSEAINRASNAAISTITHGDGNGVHQ